MLCKYELIRLVWVLTFIEVSGCCTKPMSATFFHRLDHASCQYTLAIAVCWCELKGCSFKLQGTLLCQPPAMYLLSRVCHKIWKENYLTSIALEPWLYACSCKHPTIVFQLVLSGGGEIPPSLWRGKGHFVRGNLSWWRESEEGWFWPFEPFSVNIEHMKIKCTKIK